MSSRLNDDQSCRVGKARLYCFLDLQAYRSAAVTKHMKRGPTALDLRNAVIHISMAESAKGIRPRKSVSRKMQINYIRVV